MTDLEKLKAWEDMVQSAEDWPWLRPILRMALRAIIWSAHDRNGDCVLHPYIIKRLQELKEQCK